MEKTISSFVVASVLGLSLMLTAGLTHAVGENSTYTVTVAQEQGRVTLGGTVVPYKQVTLSAETPGRVMYIAGVEGSEFRKGTVLVAISEDELKAKREAAFAALSSAQAQLRNAHIQLQYERFGRKVNPMAKNTPMAWWSNVPGATTGSNYADITRMSTTVQGAQSAVNAARSNIQGLDAKLRNARSIASMDGVIVKKFVEVGATVQPGQPLLQFADIKFLQVKVNVPARQVEALKVGMLVDARLDVQSDTIPVKVAQIAPIADDRHTIKVKFDLPIHSAAAPGMYVEVLIPDIRAMSVDVIKIPISAVKWGAGLPQVYIMRNGRPSLRAIRVGKPGNQEVTVLSGIKAGDVVLTNPDPRSVNLWQRK